MGFLGVFPKDFVRYHTENSIIVWDDGEHFKKSRFIHFLEREAMIFLHTPKGR